jgi:hypothetical protein
MRASKETKLFADRQITATQRPAVVTRPGRAQENIDLTAISGCGHVARACDIKSSTMAHTAQASFLDTPTTYNVRHRAMITASAIGATLLQSLDQTIANVALPYMQGSFSASYDETTWVLTSKPAAEALPG